MCTLDILSSPAATLSYFTPFVRKSIKFQSLSIAFSLIVSFVVLITIWSRIANSSARQFFVPSQKWHVLPAASTLLQTVENLRQLTKFKITYYKVFVRLYYSLIFRIKCYQGEPINNDRLFSAAFQSCCKRTVAKNHNSLGTLSLEIHSWRIAWMMSVVNSLFQFCDCHFSISLPTAFFLVTGYCAI